LRGLVGNKVALTLIAPEDDFAVRALDAFEPFGHGHSRRYPLVELAADLGVDFLGDAVTHVERDRRSVRLESGAELAYDVLVLAVHASPYTAFEHGACLEHAHDAKASEDILAKLHAEQARDMAIVVPPGTSWTLPAYELALMAAALGGRLPRVTLIAPEHEPLEAFGPPAAELARAELAAADVRLLTGVRAGVRDAGVVDLEGGARLRSDRIVHLAALAGPNMPGVPCDGAGFILVDDTSRVRDASDVFAVGDGTAGADKQGGLAAQQADVVAEHIAQRAGAEHAPRPYWPVLRGLVRTGYGQYYLQAEPPGGSTSAAVSEQCLWWPRTRSPPAGSSHGWPHATPRSAISLRRASSSPAASSAQ
jgi:sulfide:quinone oxidoreductase